MFTLVYLTNFTIIAYAIHINDVPLMIAGLFLLLITNSWKLDNDIMNHYQKKINSIRDHQDINQNAQEFISSYKHSLSWYQKSIAINAFKAGVEYIIKKLK